MTTSGEQPGRWDRQEQPRLRDEDADRRADGAERVERVDRVERVERNERDQRDEQNKRNERDQRNRQDARGRGNEQGDRAPEDQRGRQQRTDQDRGQARGRGDGQEQGMRQGRGGQQERGGGQVRGQGRGQQPEGPLVAEYAPPYERRSGQVAAVMLYKNGGHSVIWPDHREDVRKPWLGLTSPYTVFEVLLGVHVTEFDLRLPANGDSAFFDAKARVRWEVEDPLLVVRQNVWDVAELVRDELLAGLRNVSRRFRLTDSHRADDAVKAEVEAGRINLGRDLGLTTRVHVFIDLSDEVKKRVQATDDIILTMDTDAAEAERERIKAVRKREAIREQAAELQRFLRQGDVAEIAYQMAANPDKQWEIREAIRRERREGQADFIGLFHKLLDTGNLERHDIGEHMYEVLEYLRENSDGVLGGVTDSILSQRGGRRDDRALEGRGNRREPAERGREPFWLREGASADSLEDPHRPRELDARSNGGHAAYPDDEEQGDQDPRVHQITRVSSSAEQRQERERRERDRYDHDRDRDPDREGGGTRRPSDGFDDWDEE
ncbi:hypothetical protein ACIQM4_01080 [Streptomyces sp. NPDC091272]|uniref:hypothetical protein n=1 Tax=Streptomyces sp. NPDC091272 TaxID=3365981 RepID=UPI003804B989